MSMMQRIAPAAPADPGRTMMTALLAAGLGLAEALQAENDALAALDLPLAASRAETKLRATDAFAAAHAAAARVGARAEEGGPHRAAVQQLAAQLQLLGTENRRLLERAVNIQSRVLEAIAGAALPRGGPAQGYGAAVRGASGSGQRPAAAPLALATRA